MNVALNKNTVPGDKSAMVPGGIRLGTPAMTTRGLKEDDFEKIAEFVVRGVEIALAASSKVGPLLTGISFCPLTMPCRRRQRN